MRPVLHSGMNEINHCQETGESWATGQAKSFLPPRCRAACQSCRTNWQPLLLSNTSSRESFLPNWALSQRSNLQSFWPWRELPRTPGRRGYGLLGKPRPVIACTEHSEFSLSEAAWGPGPQSHLRAQQKQQQQQAVPSSAASSLGIPQEGRVEISTKASLPSPALTSWSLPPRNLGLLHIGV